MVHIDKLKRLEGNALECWLTDEMNDIGDVGFSGASVPVSPVTAGGQTLPYMASSDVEDMTETATCLADGQHRPAYGNVPQPTQ